MTVRIEIDRDGLLGIRFFTDAQLDESRIFNKYLERGEHFLTICEYFTANTNERHNLTVRAHLEYFESDSRKRDADIQTYNNFLAAIETTPPTVSNNIVTFPAYEKGTIDTTLAGGKIKKGYVKAVLFGQGIAAEGKWDGTINFVEDINRVVEFTGGLTFKSDNIIGFLTTETQTPTGGNIAESIGSVSFGNTLGFNANIKEKVRFGWAGAYTWYDLFDTWKWNDAKGYNWQYLKGDEA